MTIEQDINKRVQEKLAELSESSNPYVGLMAKIMTGRMPMSSTSTTTGSSYSPRTGVVDIPASTVTTEEDLRLNDVLNSIFGQGE